MNKKIIILILVLVLFLIAALGIFFYYQTISKNSSKPATINPLNLPVLNINSNANKNANINLNVPAVNIPVIPNAPVINTNSNQPDYQPVSININNFAFNPKQRTVKIGTTVTWTNDDPAPHQIAGSIFGSQPLNTGDSYSFTFTQAGTYDYHCAIHSSMTGQIIVQ
ncbi:MAG: cupredoxin family copper-binding protein [Candidatus Parcubacteria bacterium]|nr:cupredoxin family copper-binding protein [Candidatus Parcubacteria bacterium]